MKYQNLVNYINGHWHRLIVENHEDSDLHMALPHPFVAPSVEEVQGEVFIDPDTRLTVTDPNKAPNGHKVEQFAFVEQFYWDTFFTAQGLIDTDRENLIIGMTENLFYMVNKLGYVPNSSNLRWHKGRSQPPVLSMLARTCYDINQDKKWLERAYETIIKEYKNVWTAKKHPHNRLVFNGLSRYYNENQLNTGAEDESGWDYTDRFDDRALDFVPVDLNCLLYQYEIDLRDFAKIIGRDVESHQWSEMASLRKRKINKYMWHFDDGFYYDFDYVNQKQSDKKTLAAFFPMFVGIADEGQAERLVSNLSFFQTEYGLTTTEKYNSAIDGKQWAAPNGWAPLHFIVVSALKRYGYDDKAREIANAWVETVNNTFEQTGKIFEKYNVVDPTLDPTSAVYPDQHGFAWSNAITYRFIEDFSLIRLPTPEKAVYTH